MAQSELLTLDAAARTDAGAVRRARNEPDEDTVLDSRFRELHDPAGVRAVFAIADGMSHLKGGKVASAQAINMVEEGMEHYARRGESGIPGVDDLDSFLSYATERIDHILRQCSENNPNVAGMGTTLTALVVEGNTAHFAHAGDSRAYILSTGADALALVTEDQVVLQDGEPIPSNGLGCSGGPVELTLAARPLEDGDVVLLCSDGLWREVDDDALYRLLSGSPTPEAAADRLIRAANQAQGRGNIGGVVVHIGSPNIQNDPELDRVYPRPGATSAGDRRDGGSIPMPLPSVRPVSGAPLPSVARPAAPGPTTEAPAPPSEASDRGGEQTRTIAAPGTSDPRVQPGRTNLGGSRGPLDPSRPRSPIDPRSVPPGPPHDAPTSTFMAAIFGFLTGLVFMGLIWVVSARLRGGEDEPGKVVARDLETGRVEMFDRSQDQDPAYAGLSPAKVACRVVNADGEEEWRDLQIGGGADIAFVDPENHDAELQLRATVQLDRRTRKPEPVIFGIKIGQSGDDSPDDTPTADALPAPAPR